MLVYLTLLSVSFFSLHSLLNYNLAVELAMYLAVVGPALFILLLEYVKPYNPHWRPSSRSFKQDLFYLLGIQVVFIVVLKYYLISQLVALGFEDGIVRSWWPNHWPMALQLVVMLLAGEFLQYWWHRLSHSRAGLWALHSVHHQPSSVYFLNTARFHPLDKAVEFVLDIFIFIMLGASLELIAFYYVFYAVNGLLQHANLNLNFGRLNCLLATVENHRLHHDRTANAGFCNFGNNCMIWDHIFGTYRDHRDTPAQIGADGFQAATLLGQLCQPFVMWGGLNLLIRCRAYWPWRRLLRACHQPRDAQLTLLMSIIHDNQSTGFGDKHGFVNINTVEDFKSRIAIRDFADYQEDIDAQLRVASRWLVKDRVIYLAKTSGTTGAPKYIPVTEKTLRALSRSQQIAVFAVLADHPELFHGDSFVLVDNEVEEHQFGLPAGSMSGKVYGQSPAIIRNKNRVPRSLSQLPDHNQRFLALAIAALCSPNVSLFSTANPSTLLRLNACINDNRKALVSLLQHEAECSENLTEHTVQFVADMLKGYESNAVRAAIELLQSGADIRIADYFTNLKIVFCWTKGGCGYPVAELKRQLPEATQIVEVGLISSEFRATVGVDAINNLCVPLLEDNFYEFIEPARYENGERDTLLVDELQPDTEYYLIVTTASGLYRYFINDIVKTGPKVANTYSLEFVRKGKGCTNITGEKLTEFDLVSFFATYDKPVSFFLGVCFPELGLYRLFVECEEPLDERLLHIHLCNSNLEYKCKTESGRLAQMQVCRLQPGEGERYKATLAGGGSRIWQFKFLHLIHSTELNYEFNVETQDAV